MIDLDLAILAASVADFEAYEAAIRREYAFVPDDMFAAGRSKVLKSFLARHRIYLSPCMAETEMRARANIARSLNNLAKSTSTFH